MLAFSCSCVCGCDHEEDVCVGVVALRMLWFRKLLSCPKVAEVRNYPNCYYYELAVHSTFLVGWDIMHWCWL
jgi:hypothetical protein